MQRFAFLCWNEIHTVLYCFKHPYVFLDLSLNASQSLTFLYWVKLKNASKAISPLKRWRTWIVKCRRPQPVQQHRHQQQHKELQLSSSLGWHHHHFGAHSLRLVVISHCLPLTSCNIKYRRSMGQGLVLPLSHLCKFFFNTTNADKFQYSLTDTRRSVWRWTKGYVFKVVLCACGINVSSLYSLWSQVIKTTFGQRTQTEIYGMDSSVTWWANVSIPPPILFNNWTFTVQSLLESGFLIKATLQRKGPNLHTGIFFLPGCTFVIAASLNLSEHVSDIMSQRN